MGKGHLKRLKIENYFRKGKEVFMKNLRFEELGLSPEMKKAISIMGFEEATPIQSMAIPKILEGKDVVGQAQTGTGKTFAYAMPAVEMLEMDNRNLQVLVLCPTRELGVQVSEEFKKILKYKKATVLAVYGGQPIDRQIKALKRGVQIVVGTPGRIMDHMRRKTIKFDDVKMVVLDEADEMLNMGFIDDIKLILGKVPNERQTALFSATVPKPILDLSKKFQNNPVRIKIPSKELTVESIEQVYFKVRGKDKMALLSRLLGMYSPQRSMVFCNTKKIVDELVSVLKTRGYSADAIHGDLRQAQRNRVLNDFKNGSVKILVATDVAARGLDIANVEIVFNYDVPQYDEFYIHRIGRTGRMGKSGMALTFVSGRDSYKLKAIEKYAKTNIRHSDIPSIRDVERNSMKKTIDMIKETISGGELNKYVRVVNDMIEDNFSATDIAAALLKMNKELSGGGNSSNYDEKIEIVRDRKDSRDSRKFRNDRSKERKSFRDRDINSRRSNGKMTKVLVNIGRDHNISPKDIVGSIANETGIPGRSIGAIEIHENHTVVEIKKELVKDVLKIMQGNQIRGNIVSVKMAKK